MSQILIGIAGLLFLFGGKAISEFAKMDRLLAEMLGIGLAFVFGACGMMAKSAADDLDCEDPDAQ